jgi:hypothetical protein
MCRICLMNLTPFSHLGSGDEHEPWCRKNRTGAWPAATRQQHVWYRVWRAAGDKRPRRWAAWSTTSGRRRVYMVGGYQLASSASVAERWSDGLRIDDFDCWFVISDGWGSSGFLRWTLGNSWLAISIDPPAIGPFYRRRIDLSGAKVRTFFADRGQDVGIMDSWIFWASSFLAWIYMLRARRQIDRWWRRAMPGMNRVCVHGLRPYLC